MDKLGTVLIVDTDEYRHALGTALTHQGYLVEKFTDPDEAFSRALDKTKRPVGLIIVDVAMYDKNAAVLEEEIKGHPDTAHIALVFLSRTVPCAGVPAGYRVLAKPIQDLESFADQIMGYLRASNGTIRDIRLEGKLDTLSTTLVAHMHSEMESRDKTDEAIRACVAVSRDAALAAGDALRDAGVAKKAADEAKKAADEVDLGTAVGRTMSKADPVVKWTVGTAGTLIVLLASGLLALVTYLANETKTNVDNMAPKVEAFATVRTEINEEVKPELKKLQARQDRFGVQLDGIQRDISEVLKRTPKTKVP